MNVEELKQLQSSDRAFRLIDLREDYELVDSNIGGEQIRMSEVLDQHDTLPKDIPLIFHCESGQRSKAVVETLQRKFGFTNVYSLEGGLQAYLSNSDN